MLKSQDRRCDLRMSLGGNALRAAPGGSKSILIGIVMQNEPLPDRQLRDLTSRPPQAARGLPNTVTIMHVHIGSNEPDALAMFAAADSKSARGTPIPARSDVLAGTLGRLENGRLHGAAGIARK